jgi:hypothetical protein
MTKARFKVGDKGGYFMAAMQEVDQAGNVLTLNLSDASIVSYQIEIIYPGQNYGNRYIFIGPTNTSVVLINPGPAGQNIIQYQTSLTISPLIQAGDIQWRGCVTYSDGRFYQGDWIKDKVEQ